MVKEMSWKDLLEGLRRAEENPADDAYLFLQLDALFKWPQRVSGEM